jgi:hypothetical protein
MPIPTILERSASLTKKLLRVSTYFAFVVLALVGFASRAVWGAVERGAFDVSTGLVEFGDVVGTSYTVGVNGAPMRVSSATTDKTVTDVLDQFAADCSEHSGKLGRDFEALPQALASRVPSELTGPLHLGIVRKERDGRGVVACLERNGEGGEQTVVESLRTFSQTGDLSALGHVRYVAAERTRAGRTHVVSVWTDTPLLLGRMFPSEGDAPGTDPGPALRPPASQRILSASVAGAPFGVQVYRSDVTPEAVLAHYDHELPSQGWQSVPLADRSPAGRVYTRGAVDVMIFADRQEDGRTLVSLVAMPPR